MRLLSLKAIGMNIITVKQFSDYQVKTLKEIFTNDVTILKLGFAVEHGRIYIEYSEPRVGEAGIFEEVKVASIPFDPPNQQKQNDGNENI